MAKAKGWDEAEDAAIDAIVEAIEEKTFADEEERSEAVDKLCAAAARKLYSTFYDDWSHNQETNTYFSMRDSVNDQIADFEDEGPSAKLDE